MPSRGPRAEKTAANPDVPPTPAGSGRFVHEQQVVDQLANGVVERCRAHTGCGLVLGDSRLPADARQQVDHRRLVFEQHQRDHVAVRRGKSAKIEDTLQRVEHARTQRGAGRRPERLRHLGVAQMKAARPTGDVPPAPSLGNGRAVVGWKARCVGVLVLRDRLRRERQHARDVLRVLRQMAGQAAGLAGELRLRGLTLIERVEDDALLRVVRGQLQRVGAPHPSDGDRVVEEERARIFRRDQIRLDARLGKDDGLRLDGNAQSLEDGRQVSVVAIERERRLARRETFRERREPIRRRPRGVLNRGMIPRGRQRALLSGGDPDERHRRPANPEGTRDSKDSKRPAHGHDYASDRIRFGIGARDP